MIHVDENDFTWLYLYIQNMLISYWIPLMFFPVSMAANGNDSFIFSMHSYLKEKLYTLLCAVIIVFICLYLKTEPIINCSVYCEVPGVQI